MPIDYKKELETASKSMILVHDPIILMKLIVRMIVTKVRIKHAGVLLYDYNKDAYVLNISRGQSGIKIPAGFTRFDKNSPLIEIFTNGKYKFLTLSRNVIVLEDINKMIWKESVIAGGNGARELLYRLNDQMQMLNVVACVPAYYMDKLLAVLLLGAKNDEGKFVQEELEFFNALVSDVAMALRNAQLFAEVKKEAEKNRNLFLQTTLVLSSTIEAKDYYTKGHTERVTHYAIAIARQMAANGSASFPESFFEGLYIAGLLHDIGKIGIPEAILTKSGKLTKEEFEIMKNHTLKGLEILKPLTGIEECKKGVKSHHERYDGKGYPDGLKGESIPMIAAIIAVADAFDAMTSDRPYRKGSSQQAAMNEIKKYVGVQFNPLPVKALVELHEKGEV